MKTILAPTDFSIASINAINYAVEFAIFAQAKLILFNVYYIPVVPAEAPIVFPLAEVEKDAMEELNKIKNNILSKYGDKLIIECRCNFGFTVEEINKLAEQEQADIIVMGMEGAGYLSEKLIGSTTTSLIQRASCPVLAIDKDVKFTPLNKIVLACDYDKIDNLQILNPLKEIALLFNAHIYMLNVADSIKPITDVSKAASGIKIGRALAGAIHTFHLIQSINIIDGINSFANEHQIDLIVMIPRAHNIFKSLFQKSNTKQMAFNTAKPLLALHE